MRLLSVLLAVVLGMVQFGHAQDVEVERKARQFSHYYEALVSQALSRYYNSNSFLVDARVVLVDIGSALAEPSPNDPES